MKKTIIAIFLLFLAISCFAQGYMVEKVIDGKTLKLTSGEEVSLIGIEIPEGAGQKAYEFTKMLVEGKEVRLEFDVEKRDRYGRLLAYVYVVDDVSIREVILREGVRSFVGNDMMEIFVNAQIMESGYASLMTIPPNVKYADLFEKLYKEAREADRGLWAENIRFLNLKDGMHKKYYDDGKLNYETEVKDGKRISVKTYDRNGSLRVEHFFKDDKIIRAKQYDKEGNVTLEKSFDE